MGICAIKLGAKKAYLTDIDYVAVTSATHNSKLNGTEEKTVVAHSNLLDDADIQGDVMMANITGEILKLLAPSIPKNLKKDGVLILSGIISIVINMIAGSAAGGYYEGISYIPIWLVVISLAFAVLVGMVAGFFPALRAMKLSPLAAIRNE